MGEELPPLAFTGMGKFLPHGDGDGKLSPDGEFPVDILSPIPLTLPLFIAPQQVPLCTPIENRTVVSVHLRQRMRPNARGEVV